MKKYLMWFISSSLASVLFYLLLFITVVDKPLLIGWTKRAFDKKYQYYEQDKENIVVVAGSNGLYSHRCSAIEAILGKPCINYSVYASLGLSMILEKAKEVINDKSIVIMPLEFYFYERDQQDDLQCSGANLYILENENKYIFQFGLEKAMHIIFSKDFTYLFSSAVENVLELLKFKIRFNIDNLNKNGDMTKHTKVLSGPYAKVLAEHHPHRPSIKSCQNIFYHKRIIDFIAYVKSKGGIVFGSYPTTYDTPLSDEEKKAYMCIKDLYLNNGAQFIELENWSMYPTTDFYDSPVHLNEETQIVHSQNLAKDIQKILIKKGF